MTPPQTVIGIDLGGTNVRAGILDRSGKLLGWAETPIEAARGPQAGLERTAGLVEQVRQAAGAVELLGIGIGSTGPVDREKGAIQNPYTLPTWEDVDIVSPLAQRFGVPVTIENDADAAALGEYWMGAGRGASRLYMVTLGTGVGTAFICDGLLYRGANGVHLEGGHMLLDPSGPECYCGGRGCLESLASGPAIAQYAREQARQRSTRLRDLVQGDLERIDARLVSQAAADGDPLAREAMERAAYYLGLGLVNLIHLFFPDVIVLGGGGMKSYPLFKPTLDALIQRHAVMMPADQVRLELARLDQRAGVVGAGYAILEIVGRGQ